MVMNVELVKCAETTGGGLSETLRSVSLFICIHKGLDVEFQTGREGDTESRY